jgi:hypothetical protein
MWFIVQQSVASNEKMEQEDCRRIAVGLPAPRLFRLEQLLHCANSDGPPSTVPDSSPLTVCSLQSGPHITSVDGYPGDPIGGLHSAS